MYGGEQGQREGSLEHWQGLHRQVESDIHDNNAEIKLLNNKIVKYSPLHPEMTTIALSSSNLKPAEKPS